VLPPPPGIPFGVDADGVHVEGGKAIFRVDVTFEVLVGSYGGAVTVSQDGQSLVVGDFRQIDVAGGVFPRQASPLLIDPKDPWDRELLADALDLDRYLRQYGRSFPNEFPARDPSFYLALVPDVPISLIAAQLRATDDPANVLYALLLAKRHGGSPAQQYTALMAEWQAGATWGLIAHERHISEKIFLAMVIAALTPPTAAPSASSGGGAGGASGGGSSSPSARPSTQPSGSPRPTSSPTPSPSPTGSPSPPPCGLLNQLLGGCH
jgi:hypothetical protein